MMDLEILKHITASMWAMFFLGNLLVLAYCWKNDSEGSEYFTLTLKNAVFHVISSLMVFLLIEEIGAFLLSSYIPGLSENGIYHGTLSALSGMFGSLFAAWLVEMVVKKFKKK